MVQAGGHAAAAAAVAVAAVAVAAVAVAGPAPLLRGRRSLQPLRRPARVRTEKSWGK